MNHFILWTVGFFIFLFGACNGSENSSQTPPPENCNSKVISQDECFYPLPSAPHGRIFNGSYEEALHINTKGVTVGKGQWLCDKGSWKPVYKHTCLTCLPGRSIQQCQDNLNKLLTNP